MAAFGVSAAIGFFVNQTIRARSNSHENSWMRANVDALATGDQNLYEITTADFDATIEINGNGEATLCGIKIAKGKADASGHIHIADALVDCKAGGEYLCTPVRAIDIIMALK